jgi:ATP-dependent protease ClpP protease subunit
MSAAEASEYGLVDKVIEKRSDGAGPSHEGGSGSES